MKEAAVRAAVPEDRAALLDLWVEAWTAAMPAIDFNARRSWYEAHCDDIARAGAVTVVAWAPDDSTGSCPIQGFVTLNPLTHHLDQLAVRPAWQGRGLASRLISEAKRMSPRRLELHVNQDNPRAVGFYGHEGFAIIGSGLNPRSGLPIWHMEWRPSPPQPRSSSG